MAEDPVGGHGYISTTWGRHLVSEYTGLNFHQVGQLDYGTYLLYLRDAYITGLNRTEEGRQHLDDCWRMEQTKPDRAKLRQTFGKGAPTHGH
jgi:hypothetical protein